MFFPIQSTPILSRLVPGYSPISVTSLKLELSHDFEICEEFQSSLLYILFYTGFYLNDIKYVIEAAETSEEAADMQKAKELWMLCAELITRKLSRRNELIS